MKTIRILKDLFHAPVDGFIIQDEKGENWIILSASYSHLNSKPWQITIENVKSARILKNQKISNYENCKVLALHKNAASRDVWAS